MGFSATAGGTITQPETERAGENVIYIVLFIPLCPGSNQWQLQMTKC